MSMRLGNKRRLDDSRLDDWLITYADMITLILSFFVIILSFSAVKTENLEQTTRVVADQFAAPKTSTGVESSHYGKRDLPPTAPTGVQGVAVESGDLYTAIELDSAPFFASGSATLSSEGMRILAGLTPQLKNTKFDGYNITVEGHTDDVPIDTPLYPSNWELSAARAAAVVRHLIILGFPTSKLRAVGYAATMPKLPNRDGAGNPLPDNQARNRRVVIKMEKIEKNL
jgi:chemotaxis protein MotB